MPTQADAKLSAVIACYRDAEAIPVMHDRLTKVFRQLDVDYEIIFVNDASPDNAREVLAELAAADGKVTAVNHTRPFGSQSAFTSGMEIATGDAVVLLDGDLQDPPEVIPALVDQWRAGYEVVYGERVQRDTSKLMNLASKGFYRVFRRYSYVSVPLDAGDFSLLDRRVVDTLNRLPEKQRFIRGLRAWVGFRQVGVPYFRPKRMFGTSTNSALKNLGWARRGIVSLSYAPLNFIAWLALVTMAVSFLAIVLQIGLKLAYPSAVPKGITTLLLVILFLGGMQFLCLGIIGSYLAHIYEEVKGRPAYIVDEILNRPRRVPSKGSGGSRPEWTPAPRPGTGEVPAGIEHERPPPADPPAHDAKRVLVTGAGGFVGANLVRRLVADGHAVTAMTSPHSISWRLAGLHQSVELVEADMRDAEAVRGLVDRVRPDWVFHLAAHGAYEWQNDVDRVMATNLIATVHLVEACRARGCEAFVHAGSSSEYGFKDHPPSELEPTEPNSAYAVAKAAATSYCRYAARSDGFPAVTLRLYSVYGPYEDPRRLVPALITRGARNQLPELVEPEVAHDFVEVSDVEEAFVLAAKRAGSRAGEIYNIGSGTQTRLSEVVRVAREAFAIEAEPAWGSAPAREWDTASWVADNGKARSDLGWHPRLDVSAGLRRMLAWLASTPDVWSVYGVTAGEIAPYAAPTSDDLVALPDTRNS